MDEALRLQKERERIHRWRASKRQAGNDMLTIWLPRGLKLYVEDMALKRHCSPSDLIEQALTICYPLSADATDTVTDTSVQAEAVRAAIEIPYVTDTVTDTHCYPMPEGAMDHQGEYVTDTVTDIHIQAQDVTAAALETPLVTDTITDTITDTPAKAETVTEPPAPRKPPPRRKRQPADAD